MIEQYFSRTSVVTRFRLGPLAPYLDDFATTLQQQGYKPHNIRVFLRACGQLSQWLSQQEKTVTDLDETVIERYTSSLPRPPSGRLPKAAMGLHHLLWCLRHHGILTAPPCAPSWTETERWLQRYEQYLDRVRGVVTSTRIPYLRMAKRFLAACFGSGPLDWQSLRAQDITDFVRQEAATKHGGGRKLPSVAVRSILRFLVFSEGMAPGLEAVVLTPRQWGHDMLPQRLTAEEIGQALATCAGDRAKDLRNHAILMLLARLGLRAHEVVSLCLEDIDWHESRLIVRPGKTHHARVLPLLHDVGNTLAAYLRGGRPTTSSRVVFLHCRAPYLPFRDAAAISRIASRALKRAGVCDRPRVGAHAFRHSAASHMVNKGASFKDVADVLGHQSLQTTGIYAKLDLETLALVALPWRGEVP
jgi:site-specific recombinase XerD